MEKQQYIDFKFVKEHGDFEKVLGYYQLKVTGRGKQLTVLCPFHEDTKPSLRVTLETKGFHCFGCGAKGNILDFVRYMEECDLREAAVTLAIICRIDLAPQRPSPNGRPRPVRKVQTCPMARRGAEMAVEEENEAETAQITGEPQTATHGLPNGPRADVVEETINPPLRFALKLDPSHPYLTERGLSDETIKAFGLGLCQKGVMAGRIAIPIHDTDGALVGYAGRWPADEGWPEGEDRYKLPVNFHKSRVLFNLHRVFDADHLVVVEGYWSVFWLHELGIPAVALMGCSLSGEQEELLAKHGPDRLTLLLDADPAGRTATVEVLSRLASRHFVRAPALPDGSSPDTVDGAFLLTLFS